MDLLYRGLILALFVFSLPLLCFVSLRLVISSGFPVLFRQKRVGKEGKPFTMYKFRTMVGNADTMQKKYVRQNEADGPVFKIRDDPRFTRFGKFLSHTGLDELPQLWNVLRGDMSLIGPRPLPVHEAAKLKPWQQKRYAIKPGIISPWVMEGYHSRPFDEWMKSDIAYTENKSLWYDLWIFTRSAVFVGKLLVREMASILPINKYYQ